MALITCPECGKEISDKAATCPNCGCPLQQPQQTIQVEEWKPQKPKKMKNSTLSTWAAVLAFFTFTSPIGFIVAIVDLAKKDKEHKHTGSYFAIIFFACIVLMVSCPNKDDEPQKVGSVETSQPATTDTNTSAESEKSNIFHVGDVVETEDFRITYLESQEYTSDNEFLKPKEGYKYWKFTFKFENISNDVKNVSSIMDWECYADNSKVDQTYLEMDNGLDGQLSAGRETQGSLFFEVPNDVQNLELEYAISYYGNDRIVFVAQ